MASPEPTGDVVVAHAGHAHRIGSARGTRAVRAHRIAEASPVRLAKQGRAVRPRTSTPRYVVVAGPPDPQAVLLVENTTTYEEAILNGLSHRVAVIAAYGYGLNMMSYSVARWALAESLDHGRCEVLHRTGRDHQLSKLLQHSNIYFWGDLNREGPRIALALRAKIPQLALSAFCQPMCEMS